MTDDWFVTDSAQMAQHEIRQQLMAEHRPGDDEPVSIQRRRLEKAALIIDMLVFEQVGDPEDVRTVVRYLRTESMEQKYEPGVMAPAAAELAEHIDALPWPVKPA